MAVSSSDTLLDGPKKRSSTEVSTIERLKFCASSVSSWHVTAPSDSKRVGAVHLPAGHLAALAPADMERVVGGGEEVEDSGEAPVEELEVVVVAVVGWDGGEADDVGGGGSFTTVACEEELASTASSRAREYRARFTSVSLMMAGFVGA